MDRGAPRPHPPVCLQWPPRSDSRKPLPHPPGLQQWWVVQQVRWWNFLGQPDKTAQVCANALQRWPQRGRCGRRLGFLPRQRGSNPASGRSAERIGSTRRPTRQRVVQPRLSAAAASNHGDPGNGHQCRGGLRPATELDPQLDRAWYGLALELIAGGRQRDALSCRKPCTKLQPP